MMMEDADLERRLDAVRDRVVHQRRQLKDLRRRHLEAQAAASALTDEATAAQLRARGLPAHPPCPSHPPADLER